MESRSRPEAASEPFPTLDRHDQDRSPLLTPSADSDQAFDRLDGTYDDHKYRKPRDSYESKRSRRRRSSQSSSTDLEMSRLQHQNEAQRDEEEGFIKKSESRSRQRTMTLDNGDEIDLTDLRNLGNKAFLKKVTINAILILMWYVLLMEKRKVGFLHA